MKIGSFDRPGTAFAGIFKRHVCIGCSCLALWCMYIRHPFSVVVAALPEVGLPVRAPGINGILASVIRYRYDAGGH